MPREADGRYCVEDCKAWVDENIAPTHRGDDDDEDQSERGYWETYKVREQALEAELDRRKKQGELVPLDRVIVHNEQRITMAKSLFEQVPDRLLGIVPKKNTPASRKAFLERAREMITDVLSALADESMKPVDDGSSDET
jgi:hypothetical protein